MSNNTTTCASSRKPNTSPTARTASHASLPTSMLLREGLVPMRRRQGQLRHAVFLSLGGSGAGWQSAWRNAASNAGRCSGQCSATERQPLAASATSARRAAARPFAFRAAWSNASPTPRTDRAPAPRGSARSASAPCRASACRNPRKRARPPTPPPRRRAAPIPPRPGGRTPAEAPAPSSTLRAQPASVGGAHLAAGPIRRCRASPRPLEATPAALPARLPRGSRASPAAVHRLRLSPRDAPSDPLSLSPHNASPFLPPLRVPLPRHDPGDFSNPPPDRSSLQAPSRPRASGTPNYGAATPSGPASTSGPVGTPPPGGSEARRATRATGAHAGHAPPRRNRRPARPPRRSLPTAPATRTATDGRARIRTGRAP